MEPPRFLTSFKDAVGASLFGAGWRQTRVDVQAAMEGPAGVFFSGGEPTPGEVFLEELRRVDLAQVMPAAA